MTGNLGIFIHYLLSSQYGIIGEATCLFLLECLAYLTCNTRLVIEYEQDQSKRKKTQWPLDETFSGGVQSNKVQLDYKVGISWKDFLGRKDLTIQVPY